MRITTNATILFICNLVLVMLCGLHRHTHRYGADFDKAWIWYTEAITINDLGTNVCRKVIFRVIVVSRFEGIVRTTCYSCIPKCVFYLVLIYKHK